MKNTTAQMTITVVVSSFFEAYNRAIWSFTLFSTAGLSPPRIHMESNDKARAGFGSPFGYFPKRDSAAIR